MQKEEARPLAQVNLIRSGDKILYRLVNLPASIKKNAKVSLVQAPHGGEAKLSVSDPQPANQPDCGFTISNSQGMTHDHSDIVVVYLIVQTVPDLP
jgi:hypothetical protein